MEKQKFLVGWIKLYTTISWRSEFCAFYYIIDNFSCCLRLKYWRETTTRPHFEIKSITGHTRKRGSWNKAKINEPLVLMFCLDNIFHQFHKNLPLLEPLLLTVWIHSLLDMLVYHVCSMHYILGKLMATDQSGKMYTVGKGGGIYSHFTAFEMPFFAMKLSFIRQKVCRSSSAGSIY